jgi:hypothetical protein
MAFDSPEPQWPQPPGPEPPRRDQRPAWQVALASAVAALVVLLVAVAVLAAFGVVRVGWTTRQRPATVALSSTGTAVPAASQDSSRIKLPDKLAGLPRIPHTPSPLDPILGEGDQMLEANGFPTASAAYGGTEQDPLLGLDVITFPPGNDKGQQIADGLNSIGYQSFNHDGVTFHCRSAVTTTSSSSGSAQCMFYDPKGRMLVTLMSNAIGWGDAQRLGDLAAQVRRFIDQA